MAEEAYISDTHKGIDREENKDDILVIKLEHLSLYVVFDGVSTTKDALCLISEVKKYIAENIHKTENISLQDMFFEANEYALKQKIGDGASTYVALLINKKNNSHTISWLGDSRIYGFVKEKQTIKKLTMDHAVEDEPHIITRGLGFSDMKKIDFEEVEIDSEYNYVLCTDGVYEFFEEDGEDMLDILLLKSPSEIKAGFYTVIKGNNNDDATYIVI